MIAKVRLHSANNYEDHPLFGKEIVAYLKDIPVIGHPMILWYSENGESRYLRTTEVKSIEETHARFVSTRNSVYRIETMPVKFLSEKEEYSAAINGQVKEK